MIVTICIGILAVLQGAVIGYLWKYTRNRPLGHKVVGEVVSVTVNRDMLGTGGTIEFVDLTQRREFFRMTPRPSSRVSDHGQARMGVPPKADPNPPRPTGIRRFGTRNTERETT